FLASNELLDRYLPEYFIFFKPKDVVSGDFYWASELKNGKFALVTADSTGHGVPGAIMSLLNITSIEKAIDFHSEPAEILNHARNTIIDRLKKDGSPDGGKDGMDCSICVYDFKELNVKIAAANNPVWIVRNGEFIEIEPDKMPVGKFHNQEDLFTQNEFQLAKGDLIYTITDGFQDQFGGPLGKKFKTKNLRDLLVSISTLPLLEQVEKLEEAFQNWKGSLEQIDDVCIVGIRV
ncbi:MAG TPA: PP2C family protein-serine/threonine phosphatase, partial [Fluviicola sp.]|nr:PP2C family protein-serine/threonine phosphatase [Fluviicola sp.]